MKDIETMGNDPNEFKYPELKEVKLLYSISKHSGKYILIVANLLQGRIYYCDPQKDSNEFNFPQVHHGFFSVCPGLGAMTLSEAM
ncbi:MAG: hypothetical protein EZS28_020390 [Streblomastix strix]|uniref:Uncharacterized protein n=1 Tax=Streblomastix strix TaxID=222440 RepID=A0A5J4VNZ6_9EUKA|nr:MAG: hypothetical protein EZS28_020390 [Streblomastix strix]